MTTRSLSPAVKITLAAYLGMLLLYTIGSFNPGFRTWGINWWAYYGAVTPWILLALGLVMAGYLFYSGRFSDSPPDSSTQTHAFPARKYAVVSLAIVLFFGLTFTLLHTRTHFLGDGYNILTQLETENPLVKSTSVGEGLLHNFTKSALSGVSDPALLSFQIISITAGIGFVVTVLLAAGVLFKRLTDRIIFTLGLLSGGYALLFFGYVEYYSVFALSVGIFSLVGLLIARGKLNRWWILPCLAFAIFLHVFGLALIPAAIYLLVSDTSLGRKIAGLPAMAKWAITLVVALAGVTVFLYLYNASYAFRFAFVPFAQNRFTVDGYTLASWQHIRDLLNLWILLVPAAPILIILGAFLPRTDVKGRDILFLSVLALSALVVTVVADPVLGMPRDWDLFAFAGIPIVTMLFYLLINNRQHIVGYPALSALAIALGFFVLVPRVASQAIPDIGVKHFESYLTRNRAVDNKARAYLIEYYRRSRDSAGELKAKSMFRRHNTEGNLLGQGLYLFSENQYDQAAQNFRQALLTNPRSAIAYTNLGKCYLRFDKPDSALLFQKIAIGLDPYDPITLNNLGLAYYYNEDYPHAERAWHDALERDTSLLTPRLFLMRQYKKLNQPKKFDSVVASIVDRPDLPIPALEDIGMAYLVNKRYDQAGRIYRRALNLGMDPAKIDDLKKSHPLLVIPPR